MTICIGGICEGGSSIVLATDTMLTNQGLSIQFEQPARKMTRLSDACVALTAGDALAHTELFTTAQADIAKLKAPSVLEIVDRVKYCYQVTRKREIQERILNPRGFPGFREFYEAQRVLIPDIALAIQTEIERYDYGLEILIAGVSEGKAHIYGVSDPGTSKPFDAVGFHAIGSGLPHAINTMIARGWHHALPLEDGLVVVYEAKKMAEKAPGVGSTITDISIIIASGIMDVPRERIPQLHQSYEKWVRKESDWRQRVTEILDELGVRAK